MNDVIIRHTREIPAIHVLYRCIDRCSELRRRISVRAASDGSLREGGENGERKRREEGGEEECSLEKHSRCRDGDPEVQW